MVRFMKIFIRKSSRKYSKKENNDEEENKETNENYYETRKYSENVNSVSVKPKSKSSRPSFSERLSKVRVSGQLVNLTEIAGIKVRKNMKKSSSSFIEIEQEEAISEQDIERIISSSFEYIVPQPKRKQSLFSQTLSDYYEIFDHEPSNHTDIKPIAQVVAEPQILIPEVDESFPETSTNLDKKVSLKVNKCCAKCKENDNMYLKHPQYFTKVSELDETMENRTSVVGNIIEGNKTPKGIFYFIRFEPNKWLSNILKRKKSSSKLILEYKFLDSKEEIIILKHNIGCFREYIFNINKFIYLYLKNCDIIMDLYLDENNQLALLGNCNLHFQKAVQNLNSIFEEELEVNNRSLTLCNAKLKFRVAGKLILRYTIKGKKATFDLYKPPMLADLVLPFKGNGTIGSLLNLRPSRRSIHATLSVKSVTSVELQNFQEGLKLVLARNKALRVTPEEVAEELNERVKWMHEELNWRLTLQENAILNGTDPNNVRWRQWKTEMTSYIKTRSPLKNSLITSDEINIEIEVKDVTIDVRSDIGRDNRINKIYIEYSFLNCSGKHFETKSLRKVLYEPIIFNFRKSFPLGYKDAKMISEMMKLQECIQFNVVCEPDYMPNEFPTAYAIGTAEVSLHRILHSNKDTIRRSFPIIDYYEEICGNMTIEITGIFALRAIVLHTMSPNRYNVRFI